MKIVSPFVGLIATLSLLVVSATASASSEKEMTTKSVFTTPTSWLGLKPNRFGGSYFGWFFMNGEAFNRGNPDDSFSIQNFGLTYKTESNTTWGLWYASTLAWDEKGQSNHETANPYIEVNKFGMAKIFGDVTVSAMAQLYVPVTEEWRENGTTEVFGFAWLNKPLSKHWELEYHANPRYSHHKRWRTTKVNDSGETEVHGLPGFLYLQELKARYIATQNLKVFQLLGLQTEWRHRGAHSDAFKEMLEIETGVEWLANKHLWLQASIRQNIVSQPYFRDFNLYPEDQTEYQLRLLANM